MPPVLQGLQSQMKTTRASVEGGRDRCCAISGRIAAASEEVRAQAAAARVAIDRAAQAHLEAIFDVGSSCDLLYGAVARAEAHKLARLDSEGVAVDHALAEIDSYLAACDSRSEFDARGAPAQLGTPGRVQKTEPDLERTGSADPRPGDAAVRLLLERIARTALTPVEPTQIFFEAGSFLPSDRACSLGRIVAPQPPSPEDLSLHILRVVPLGPQLTFNVVLQASPNWADDASLEATLTSLLPRLEAGVTIRIPTPPPGCASPERLPVVLSIDVACSSVVVTAFIPESLEATLAEGECVSALHASVCVSVGIARTTWLDPPDSMLLEGAATLGCAHTAVSRVKKERTYAFPEPGAMRHDPVKVEQLEVTVVSMLSGNASLEIEALAAFRDLVGSAQAWEYNSVFCDVTHKHAGLFAKLIDFVTHATSPTLQLDALRSLLGLVESRMNCFTLAKLDALVPAMLMHVVSADPAAAEMAISVLSRVVEVDTVTRDQALASGVVAAILNHLDRASSPLPLVRKCFGLVAAIVRRTSESAVSLVAITPLLPRLALALESLDPEELGIALDASANVPGIEDDAWEARARACVDAGITRRVVGLLCHPRHAVVDLSLEALDYVLFKNSDHSVAHHVVSTGALPFLREIILQGDEKLMDGASKVLSIVAGCGETIVQAIIDCRLVHVILDLAAQPGKGRGFSKLFAITCVARVSECGSFSHVDFFVRCGAISALISAAGVFGLDAATQDMVLNAVEGLASILRAGELHATLESGSRNAFMKMFVAADARRVLERCASSVNHETTARARALLATYDFQVSRVGPVAVSSDADAALAGLLTDS